MTAKNERRLFVLQELSEHWRSLCGYGEITIKLQSVVDKLVKSLPEAYKEVLTDQNEQAWLCLQIMKHRDPDEAIKQLQSFTGDEPQDIKGKNPTISTSVEKAVMPNSIGKAHNVEHENPEGHGSARRARYVQNELRTRYNDIFSYSDMRVDYQKFVKKAADSLPSKYKTVVTDTSEQAWLYIQIQKRKNPEAAIAELQKL